MYRLSATYGNQRGALLRSERARARPTTTNVVEPLDRVHPRCNCARAPAWRCIFPPAGVAARRRPSDAVRSRRLFPCRNPGRRLGLSLLDCFFGNFPRRAAGICNDGRFAIVTIAIAAKCYLDQCIVMVSDRRVSFQDVVPAADNMMLKELTMGHRWCALFAGDTGPAIPVAQRARFLLASFVPPRANPGDEDYESLAQAKRAVREAYQQEWTELATDEILRPCGLTIDELKRLGHAHLGPEYATLNKALRSFDLGIEFLVCGFDHLGFGHLFVVKNPGKVQSLGQMDYWAVGSGTYMALASLTGRPLGLTPCCRRCLPRL